jgi:hypothetical protein
MPLFQGSRIAGGDGRRLSKETGRQESFPHREFRSERENLRR